MKAFLTFLVSFCFITSEAQITDSGHPEHFIGGMAIGGLTSYLIYRKTDNKFKSWAVGAAASAIVGLGKELIDTTNDSESTFEDFGFTFLGGAVGACIVIPLKSKKPKEVTYLF